MVASCFWDLGGEGLAGLGVVEEEGARGDQRHQYEPGDEGAAAEGVLPAAPRGGKRTAGEDEAGVRAVDVTQD